MDASLMPLFRTWCLNTTLEASGMSEKRLQKCACFNKCDTEPVKVSVVPSARGVAECRACWAVRSARG